MYEQYGMGQYPFPWGGVTPPRLPLGTIRTSTLMRADAEPRSKLLPSIFGSLGRRGRKSSPPGVKGAHNGC